MKVYYFTSKEVKLLVINLKTPNPPPSKIPYPPKKAPPLHHTNPAQSAYKTVCRSFFR
jgi:hypothetical protein